MVSQLANFISPSHWLNSTWCYWHKINFPAHFLTTVQLYKDSITNWEKKGGGNAYIWFVGMRQLMNEQLITINKKPNTLLKPVIQKKKMRRRKRRRENVCQLHTLSTKFGWEREWFLMQSEYVWEVAGVSFVDKLFCLETSQFTGYRNFHNLRLWLTPLSSFTA